MELWAILQFTFALVVAIGCITLTIAELHIIERAEEQSWQELREKIAAMR